MTDYVPLYTDGGGDPTLEQIDIYLRTHFNAIAVNAETLAARLDAMLDGRANDEIVPVESSFLFTILAALRGDTDA